MGEGATTVRFHYPVWPKLTKGVGRQAKSSPIPIKTKFGAKVPKKD